MKWEMVKSSSSDDLKTSAMQLSWESEKEIEPFGIILNYKCPNCSMVHYHNVLPKSVRMDSVHGEYAIDVKVYARCLCTKCLKTNIVVIKRHIRETPVYR